MTEIVRRGRRPPPAPPALQRFPVSSSTPVDVVIGHPDAGLLEQLQPRPPGSPTPINTVPAPFHLSIPMPRLVADAPGSIDQMVEYLPHHRVIIPRRLTWVALMSWLFGTCVLILVLVPTTAIPKLMGPFKQPVSAAAFGPPIALFAILAIVIAVGGGAWLRAAMGYEYSNTAKDLNEQD